MKERIPDLGLFGTNRREELNQLLKALQANTGTTDVKQLTGGGALQLQSLESTLVVLTGSESNANFLRLWKNIPKDQAYSTIEEYTTQLGVGFGDFGWSGQMDLPDEADPIFKREVAFVKFIRKQWKVSDVATMVRSITDQEIIAKRSSLLNLLRTVNESLYWGDSDLIPEMIDGFEKVITQYTSPYHIIDARNGLSESDFQNLAEIIVSNFGNVEGAVLYVSPGGMNAISNLILPGQRFLLNQIGSDGKIAIGYGVDRIRTNYGTIIPQIDLSITAIYEGRGVPTIPDPSNPTNRIEGATSQNAPNTPTVSVTTSTGVPGSKWSSTSSIRPAGVAYRYRVAAGNKYGLSVASAPVTATPANGGAVNINITRSATGNLPTFYEIYSEKQSNSGVYRLLKRIPANPSGPTTTFQDLNHDIPGTTRMFLLDFTSTGEQRACTLKRLAPALSQELAKIGPYRWGYTYLYLTPVYYAPLRFAMIKNVDVDILSASKYYDL